MARRRRRARSRGKACDCFEMGDRTEFVERSLALLPWLSIEDAFCLPRGECCDPLPLHLVGRFPGAGVEHHLAVLLERLPLEDLGEEVRGVLVGRDVLHLHDAGTPHLAQLEELAVDVAGMLRRGILVAQLPRPLVVGLDHYVALALVADELQKGDNVDHLDSALRKRHELRLGG